MKYPFPSRRFLTAALAIAALLPAAQGNAQDTVLFAEDWTLTPSGQPPASVQILKGAAIVTDHNGGRYLRMEDRTDIEIVFPRALPDHFVVEFDMVVPSTHAYPVEVRAALAGEGADYRRTNLRMERATAHCGAIASGVYGVRNNRIRSDRTFAGSQVRCRVEVDGRRIQVAYADRTPVALDDIDFGRTDRIRLTIPAKTFEVAYLGPIRVSSRSPDAGTVAVRSGTGAPAAAPGAQTDPGQPATPATRPAETVAATPDPRAAPVQRDSGTPAGTRPVERPAAAVPPDAPPAPAGDPAAPVATQPQSSPTTTAPAAAGIGQPVNAPAGGAAARAQELFAAGASVSQAIAALMQEFALSEGAAIRLLLQSSYTIDAVLGWAASAGRSMSASVELLTEWVTETPSLRQQRIIALVRGLYMQYNPAPMDLIHTTVDRFALVDVLRGLKQAGVHLTSVAPGLLAADERLEANVEALRVAFSATAAQITGAMIAAGTPTSRQIQVLVDNFALNLEAIMVLFRNHNLTPEQVGPELFKVTVLTPEQTVAMFYQAGYDLGNTIRAAADWFNRPLVQDWQLLFQQINAPAEALVNGLIDGLGLQPDDWLTEFVRRGPVALPDMLKVMQLRGIDAAQATSFAKDAGFTAGQVIGPVVFVFATVPAAAAKFAATQLINAGYTPTAVGGALKTQFNESASFVAARLSEAGVGATGIRDALVSVFNLTVDAAVAILSGMGIS